jgi:hypothetical protein
MNRFPRLAGELVRANQCWSRALEFDLVLEWVGFPSPPQIVSRILNSLRETRLGYEHLKKLARKVEPLRFATTGRGMIVRGMERDWRGGSLATIFRGKAYAPAAFRLTPYAYDLDFAND